MAEANNKCDFCETGLPDPTQCTYCNGTGEYNKLAESYVKNHICQCIILDRLNCPICKKQCHHDTSLNPKQTIDDGFGGVSQKPMVIDA